MKKEIGELLKDIRLKNNLTQKKMASIFFLTEKTISNYENSRRLPDINFLRKVCEKFNVSMEIFMEQDRRESRFDDLVVAYKNDKCAIYDKGQSCYLTKHIYDGVLLSKSGNHIVYKCNKEEVDGSLQNGEITYSAIIDNFGNVKEFPKLQLGYNGMFLGDRARAYNKETGKVHLIDNNGNVLSEGYTRIRPVEGFFFQVNEDLQCSRLYYGLEFVDNNDYGFTVIRRDLLDNDGQKIDLKFKEINASSDEIELEREIGIDEAIELIKKYGAGIINIISKKLFLIEKNYLELLKTAVKLAMEKQDVWHIYYCLEFLTIYAERFIKPQRAIRHETVIAEVNMLQINPIEKNYIRRKIEGLIKKLYLIEVE